MTEHDEQHIIAKQPTLLERLRLTDPEAAQAIERLERELANTQAAYKKACDIAAWSRAEIASLRFYAMHVVTCPRSGVDYDKRPELKCECGLDKAPATPATHPFREVSPIIDKCGECGEHPDHPIHNPAPALTIAAIKARQVSGEDKE